jgi:uncharacterized protein YjbI with pentapeptide repeats
MANDEHVALLRQGVVVWNEWRLKNLLAPGPDLRAADLSGAELSGADLHRAKLIKALLIGANLLGANLQKANLIGADLQKANLYGADLDRANLNGAKLVETNLNGANLHRASLHRAKLIKALLGGANLSETLLRGADLSGASLHGANLNGANLSGADLSGALLAQANLSRAIIHGANLTGANLYLTVFGDIDLTSVIGLETCQHEGLSIIDHRTLERSKQLPLPFLRGVGLPDSFIEYLPTLLNKAIESYSCFISYSTKDEEFAERLYADLQNKGVRCWFAPHDLRIGDKILDKIDAAIRLRDKVLLILSEHSIRSDWVEDEVTAGFEEERKRGQAVLFPVRLDETVMKTNEAWAVKLRAVLSVTSSTGKITTPTKRVLSACCAI